MPSNQPPMTQPFLGILSLDTAFPRIAGDVGNPQSYPFPARLGVVAGAESPRIVRPGRPDPDLVAAFAEAARALEAEGAAALVSTCGFLASVQREIAGAVRIPVMLSALTLWPVIAAARAGPVGILTASAAALGPESLAAAGIPPRAVHVAGLEEAPAFADTFLAPKAAQPARLDRAAVEAAVLSRARALIAARPEVSALLLECGNLPPYAQALRRETGRPVFHLLDGARLLMGAAG